MLGQFVGFDGRIGRGTWWLGQLIGLMILGAAMAAIGMAAHSAEDSSKPGLGIIGIAGITYIICLVINVSVSVKRYHDRDKSGWWLFVVFIPLAGGIWQLIELGFCSGDDAPNRFGPPPGSAARRADLENEISGPAGGGSMSKLDDNYMAEYARKIALQQAEAQAQANISQSSFGTGSAAPVFGKR
jgi:uncharacterized membrane protein YhaH (DUF805 family)